MEDRVYLIATSTRISRMTRSKPQLKGGEIAFQINIDIAQENFRSPVATAHLTVPEGAVVLHPEVELTLIEEDEEGEE